MQVRAALNMHIKTLKELEFGECFWCLESPCMKINASNANCVNLQTGQVFYSPDQAQILFDPSLKIVNGI